MRKERNAAIDRAGDICETSQVLDEKNAHSAPVESLVRFRPSQPLLFPQPSRRSLKLCHLLFLGDNLADFGDDLLGYRRVVV